MPRLIPDADVAGMRAMFDRGEPLKAIYAAYPDHEESGIRRIVKGERRAGGKTKHVADADVLAMRRMFVDGKSRKLIVLEFPHVSAGFVYGVLRGEHRPEVQP